MISFLVLALAVSAAHAESPLFAWSSAQLAHQIEKHERTKPREAFIELAPYIENDRFVIYERKGLSTAALFDAFTEETQLRSTLLGLHPEALARAYPDFEAAGTKEHLQQLYPEMRTYHITSYVQFRELFP